MFSEGNKFHVSVSGSEMYAKFSLKILGRKFISVYRKTRRISGKEYRKLKVLFYFHPKLRLKYVSLRSTFAIYI